MQRALQNTTGLVTTSEVEVSRPIVSELIGLDGDVQQLTTMVEMLESRLYKVSFGPPTRAPEGAKAAQTMPAPVSQITDQIQSLRDRVKVLGSQIFNITSNLEL